MIMFRQKRSDTAVESIEDTYGIDLHARRDMLLGNLLRERGFESQTQLLTAYRSGLKVHARRRRVFLSFHADDLSQVRGFRLMVNNPKVALDLYDSSLQAPINSEQGSYIRQALRQKIAKVELVLCLIGNGTAWREWVDFELSTAIEFHKGICGVRLKDSRGRTPPLLTKHNAPIARWDMQEIVSAIEAAAARRT